MILKVYSVYDAKVKAYGGPFFQTNAGEAIRTFTDIVNDERTTLHRHPTDYVLFEIGEWDNQVGQLKATVPPINLGLASEYVQVKSPHIPQFELPFGTVGNNGTDKDSLSVVEVKK